MSHLFLTPATLFICRANNWQHFPKKSKRGHSCIVCKLRLTHIRQISRENEQLGRALSNIAQVQPSKSDDEDEDECNPEEQVDESGYMTPPPQENEDEDVDTPSKAVRTFSSERGRKKRLSFASKEYFTKATTYCPTCEVSLCTKAVGKVEGKSCFQIFHEQQVLCPPLKKSRN